MAQQEVENTLSESEDDDSFAASKQVPQPTMKLTSQFNKDYSL